MNKTIIFFLLIFFFNLSNANTDENFSAWVINFKKEAVKQGISNNTVDLAFKNIKYLEKVIEYDRRQPEFYEDTNTYVKKRATKSRAKIASKYLKKNKDLFNEIETKFKVEKEILLALWGIETNFGKYVGKMDLLSSLATLSYDKRRSQFFTKELILILKLIDKNIIEINDLYGSWAGAYGNFQFMPSTIYNYAIDYDKNGKIELKKSLPDALASAANYINKIGWKYKSPCFYNAKMTIKIDHDLLNKSAKKINFKQSVNKWEKKGIKIENSINLKKNLKSALVFPDNKEGSPLFIVFDNYEKILKWNRSLRFAISVCTLANLIKEINVN